MSVDRSPWPSVGTAAALLVVVALVAVVTQVDAGSGRAKVRTMSASGAASMSGTVAGDVVVRADDMKPGGSVAGTVTVKNSGDATGAFRLAQVDVLDTPGAGGGRLSKMLRMTVEDAPRGRRLYNGELGAMRDRALGYLKPGEERAYRFTLTHPARAAASGDRYAGSRVETTFDWTAETGEPPPVRDTAPPTVLARSAGSFDGRTTRVALTCSEGCNVVGLAGGSWAAPPEPLEGGKPALLTVQLSAAQASALDGLLARRGAAALPLRVTVADAVGNRRTTAVALHR